MFICSFQLLAKTHLENDRTLHFVSCCLRLRCCIAKRLDETTSVLRQIFWMNVFVKIEYLRLKDYESLKNHEKKMTDDHNIDFPFVNMRSSEQPVEKKRRWSFSWSFFAFLFIRTYWLENSIRICTWAVSVILLIAMIMKLMLLTDYFHRDWFERPTWNYDALKI